ncbi:hypothetical protein [uncultured Microbacterium sp.]|uniref:hypothetical protein n=1 Tax=uncultured Microbacterium sp. TaxID=191216 RepID=UPI0028D2AACA|nr:hypothetical protein [uncultured Microbacterium sp.]
MTDLQKTNANTLHWWVVTAAAVSLAAPLVTEWAFVLQVAALVFGVVAFFRVTGGQARAVIATAVVIVGMVLIAQVVGGLVASSLENSFTDDSVQIG